MAPRTLRALRSLSVVLVVLTAQGLVQAITTGSLLNDMTDLQRLAEQPSPAYTTKQFSSYDRASTDPQIATEKNWFANGDCGRYLRIEERAGRKEHVMMDIDGPGAIVRIWSANPKGTLRIYLDGGAEPVLQAPMSDLLGGKVEGLPKPIAGERSAGWNLYFPIPYAKHCKVTSDQGDFYYHVNYRTYPAGTEVRTFVAEDLKQYAEEIKALAKKLASPRSAVVLPGDAAKTSFSKSLAAGAGVDLVELEGAKAIRLLEMTLSAKDLAAAARGVVIQMTFDGEQTVESPVGDFFGTAPGLNAFEALPCGIVAGSPTTLYSHWVMPFKSRARIAVRNLGKEPVQIAGTAASVPYSWTSGSMHFHAKWRIQRDLPTRPFTDWAHLECTGSGRFVGGSLHVVNPVRDWWGEGDEKIYVDGEAMPSHFGTGTEDYYGYAWCNPALFVHAYHNQPRCDGPGNYGNTSVNRFHIIDDIPFTKQFKFDIENWHSHVTAKTVRAAVSYWYAQPGGKDFFAPLAAADLVLTEVPEYQVPRVPGALEGEKLKVVSKTGKLEIQDLGERYSNGCQLWWTQAKPGEKLELTFEAKEAGRKHVMVRLTKARDYGQVQLYVNGQKAGAVMDLYNPDVIATEEIDLGAFDLKAGENQLGVEITGANEKAIQAYMFGLDYVKLK
ncbi:MAG TPA: DUF2961 domain-containing protein [Phycisphaerae bacterium]|nr:DUF2961 domain-containing protein [Phycisphaerae bacterium]HRY66421.1 DUF2961 domain-containing protein [Phycisphaerae bacterium]HSA25871.1 DUF2961 domain-containing protein [Phycisphaerae bacterium]